MAIYFLLYWRVLGKEGGKEKIETDKYHPITKVNFRRVKGKTNGLKAEESQNGLRKVNRLEGAPM